MRTTKLLLQAMFVLGLLAMTSVFAKDYSQKTFLMPRPVGVNLPMEKSIWHEYTYQKLDLYNGHRVRSHFDLTPFYQSNTDRHDTGEYFAIGKGNGFKVGPTGDARADINGNYLIHDLNLDSGPESPLEGNVSFKPSQEIWGVRLDYFQDVDHPCKNLFFRFSMPIVYVQNNMGMKIENNVSVQFGNQEFTVADFFAGHVNVTQDMDEDNMQAPLTKSKINGKRSKTGIADLDLGLGYKFYNTKKAHLYLSLGLTIPTEERNRGEYLFDAVAGNGNHCGFGIRMDSGITAWENKKAAVRFLFDLDYRYLFSATEYRMVMPKNTAINGFFSQYYLAGLKDQRGEALFPAANILTQSMRVEPGSMFDAMLALSFKSSGFVIDLGYNLYYKDQEKLWLKEWTDGVYGISATDFDTVNSFDDAQIVGSWLTKSDLDLDSAKTPSITTHKVFAGFGYQFNVVKKCPSLVGLGGSYEFAQENSAFEQYALWLKLGISF